uniref:Uncharacterized protein n=1 Tax=Timema genevievae TaxID=629358 RepID=A0A7R9JP47_TIMGE|nr:unnamed protein product [Timema genevievae]
MLNSTAEDGEIEVQISAANSDIDTVLDRAAPKRSVAVARQSSNANGITSITLQLHVLNESCPTSSDCVSEAVFMEVKMRLLNFSGH